MLPLLAAHVVLALLAPAAVRAWGRRAFLVLALAPAAVTVYALSIAGRVHDAGQGGELPSVHAEWIPQIGMTLDFRIDALSWFMLLVVGGVGTIVLVYCAGYFSATASGLGRFGGVLVAFAGAMAGLVTADNTLMLYVFWELTTVFSYLLIGHYADRKAGRRAAMQAIVVTTGGGLAMLVGIVILGETSSSGYSLSGLLANPPSGTAVTAAVVCLLIGALSKSALIPLHFWLPSAMAAPTPVSAYLHAAAMVKAGVYLVARFAPAYSHLSVWTTLVVTLGLGTFLLGGYRALRQYDLKLVLAYGTVSQLGFLVLLLGLGTRSAALAGLALLGAHAMFKSALFLAVGAIDAVAGTRDLRRLSGVGRRLPVLATAGGLAVASMVGLPPLAGYVAKESALGALVDDGVGTGPGWLGPVLVVGVVVGSVLTFGYGLRWWWGAFCSKGTRRWVSSAPIATGDTATSIGTSVPHPSDAPLETVDGAALRRPGWLLTLPPLALALAGLAAGLAPHLGQSLLESHADLYPRGHSGHLGLWAGWGVPLALTAVVVGVGLVLFWARDAVASAQWRLAAPLDADRVYRRIMRRLDDLAADVTARTQRGSLPAYLTVILSILVIGPGGVLLTRGRWPSEIRLWDTPAQVIPVVVILIVVVLVARSRRRLKAALLVGMSGYATAALFVLHGAPDLALTQVLVETITLVVMVLVLRRLPPYFSDRPLARSRWLRLGLAVAVGLTAMGLALVAPSVRIHAPVTTGIADAIYEFGGGRNIVNVMLVDTRAWDTMGEISVLLVAATGVASLVFLRRRTSEILRASQVPDGTKVWGGATEPDPGAALRRGPSRAAPQLYPWLPAGGTLAPRRRSLIFEVVTRFVFHAMVVVALYLLFAGHNQPGGGFAAGLVVGIALIVRYLAGGRYELSEALPVQPGLLLGLGLFLSAGTGLAALILGGNALESVIWHLHVPLVGDVKLVTALFFDLGVFLVVVGLVLDILRSLGAEIDRQGEVVPRDDAPAGTATGQRGEVAR